eukprot:11084355-Heterocapsa_arctica.AAC.1
MCPSRGSARPLKGNCNLLLHASKCQGFTQHVMTQYDHVDALGPLLFDTIVQLNSKTAVDRLPCAPRCAWQRRP